MSILQQELVENCFQNPLMSFSAALGVHCTDYAWHKPGSYTHYLSGLVYCNQVLLSYSVLSTCSSNVTLKSAPKGIDALLKEWNTN
jgi:hypothetical protein